MTDDALVTSERSTMGFASGSTGTATVTGSSSTWNNSSSLTVGESGAGTLNVEDGGQVTS